MKKICALIVLLLCVLVSANGIGLHGSANSTLPLRQVASVTSYPITSVSAAEVMSEQILNTVYATNSLKIVIPNVVGETNTGGTLTCTASVYLTSLASFTQFKFGGNSSGSTTADFLVSDELSIAVAANTTTYIFIWCSNSASIIPGMNEYETGTGQVYQGVTEYGTTVPDLTMTGGVTSTADGFQFGAVVVAGRHNHPAVAAWGDSINYGIGESGTNTGDTPIGGVIVPSIYTTVATANYGVPGDSMQSWVANHTKRIQLAPYFSSFINEYGPNDFGANFSTAVQVEGYNVSMTAALAPYGPMISATVPPSGSSSTDNYATTTNQTPCSCNAQKQIYNTWVRTLTPHYFEVAGALEAVQGDGIWIVDGTSSSSPWSDVHPTGSVGYPAVQNSGNVNPAWIQ